MPTDEMQIRTLRDDWIEAVKSKNVDRFIELVTDDVVVIHPNGRTATGKEQLRADLVASFVRMTICNQTIEWDELMVSGDLAVERARIKTTVLPTGGETFQVESITIVVLTRKPVWRIARTMAVQPGQAK